MSTTTTTAYGSITIVDITDVGEFSIYPMSNSPLSVVYNPDQNTYTPNWSTNPLELQPMIYYAGKQLDSTLTEVSVQWRRKDGIQAAGSLGEGEAQEGWNLKVSANKLSTGSGILTYICTARYEGLDFPNGYLEATGQITFNLIKHAESVKKCSIVGDTVFKYNTSGALTNGTKDAVSGGTYLELTADLKGVTMRQWQYKTSTGWDPYPMTSGYNSSNTDTTLKVFEKEAIFTGDALTIRALTNRDDVYDFCTIIKLKDGAPGSATVSAVLNNDDQWIACDDKGTPLNDPLTNVTSTITIYEGGVDVTKDWTISCKATNATGSYDSATYTYSVSAISDNNANIEFKCEKKDYAPIVKNFSLTKLKAGADGKTPTVYSLQPNAFAINRKKDGTFDPSKIKFTAYSQTGDTDKTVYKGRFNIYVNDATATAYHSEVDETSCEFTPPAADNIKTVRCDLYKAGGATKVDSQTVVITNDGAQGDQGDKGDDGTPAINVVLGNQADIIPCTSDGKTKSAMTLTIPFTGYLGINKTACSVVATGHPDGMTISKNESGTKDSGGTLELSVAANSTLGNTNSGTITLTFTCEGSTLIHYYQWSKSIQAENAVLFEIYAPEGNIIENKSNSVKLHARLMDGSVDKTNDATYKWDKYVGGKYTTVGDTGAELTVSPEDVSGYASYKCTATYGTNPEAYYVVMDKSDPVQAQVYCSLGTQILNGKGYGAVYTKIFRNGEEIDKIKSERFLTGDPSDKGNGYYYLLNSTNKNVTLRKHNGSAWVNASTEDAPTATYNYTFRDRDGNITSYNNNTTVSEKVFYVDGTLVDKKIVIDVEVVV